MAVTATPYRKVLSSMLGASINFTSDTIKAILLTSSYTPNYDTHQYKSDLTNEVSNGNGYTTGGVTLGSKSVTYTAANSWGTTWATGTTYTAGQIVRPTSGNGHIYLCQTGGTSHASTEPTWPTTRGATVADNTVTWEEIGTGITVVTAANPQWTNATITARYCAYVDTTPSTDATRPLIGLVDFGSDVTSTNGTYQVTVDSTLGIIYFPTR